MTDKVHNSFQPFRFNNDVRALARYKTGRAHTSTQTTKQGYLSYIGI